jgi:hypothetical protein
MNQVKWVSGAPAYGDNARDRYLWVIPDDKTEAGPTLCYVHGETAPEDREAWNIAHAAFIEWLSGGRKGSAPKYPPLVPWLRVVPTGYDAPMKHVWFRCHAEVQVPSAPPLAPSASPVSEGAHPWPIVPNPYVCLYSLAMTLRGEADGSAPLCSTDLELRQHMAYLRARLDLWGESKSASEAHFRAFLEAVALEIAESAPWILEARHG